MEFYVAVDQYMARDSQCEDIIDHDNNDENIKQRNAAEAFTNQGPPTYSGNILDDPEAVWLEDQWNEKRIQEADLAIQQQKIGVPLFWKQKYISKAGNYWYLYNLIFSNYYYIRYQID